MRIARVRTGNYLQVGPYVALYRHWQDYEFNALSGSTPVPGHVRALYLSASAWIEDRFGNQFEMAKIVQNHEAHDPWLDTEALAFQEPLPKPDTHNG